MSRGLGGRDVLTVEGVLVGCWGGELAAAVEDLLLDLLPVPHGPIVGVRVQAEYAPIVAIEGQANPVAFLVGRGFVLGDLSRVGGIFGRRSAHRGSIREGKRLAGAGACCTKESSSGVTPKLLMAEPKNTGVCSPAR